MNTEYGDPITLVLRWYVSSESGLFVAITVTPPGHMFKGD
jgi:hypothetical protein